MADFSLAVTDAGLSMITDTAFGGTIIFTGILLGSGSTSESAQSMSSLVKVEVSLPISSCTKNGSTVVLKAVLQPDDVTETFTWREVGIMAKSSFDETEILYAYGNAGNMGDTIPGPESGTLDERILEFSIIVGNTASVTAVLDSKIYATLEDLAKINDVIPLTHTVDSGIHIFTGLTREGLVPIQFAATADYTAGQTITIDSVRYTVALSSGDTPDGIVWKAGTKQLGLCDSTNQTLIIIQSPDNVPAHNVDPESHPDIRAMLSNHEGRITRLENILLSDITGNPFLITFENLDGLRVTGTWNQAQARMEF